MFIFSVNFLIEPDVTGKGLFSESSEAKSDLPFLP